LNFEVLLYIKVTNFFAGLYKVTNGPTGAIIFKNI